MGIKVAKFGGSSLADSSQFHKVESIIHSDQQRRYIVPSAPGKRNSEDAKITDLLYLCHSKAQQSVSFDDVFDTISDRFLGIIQDLGLTLDLGPYLEEIRNRISAGASADYTASRGEYLNGIILADLLKFDFIDPAQMIFFDRKGVFDSKRTQAAVQEKLSQHPYAVIPGFYGSTPDGEIKTFSRGGSDITGAIIARGVNASLYENWTDVSGFLKADPRIVKNPKPIDRITYRELRELAYAGATVLHEETIFPVREANIPVNIKNTNAPEDTGTMIVSDDDPCTHTGTITGIAGQKDFTIITIEKALMNAELGIGRKLLSILEENHVSFEHLPSGIDTLSAVISNSQLNGKLDKILAEIQKRCQPDSIEVYSNIAMVATVGRGMVRTPGIAGKVFMALGNSGVNVRMIDQGSSELNIIVGVECCDFEKAMQAIYSAFFD